MEYFKKVSKFTTNHSTIISLLAATMPFIYATLATILFTGGDSRTANYIFQNFGLFEIWASGLIDILNFILLIVLAAYLIVYFRKFISLDNTHGYFNYYYGTAFALYLIIAPLAALIGLVAGLIMRVYKRKRGKKTSAETNPVGYFVFLGTLILYFSILNFPNLPYTKLTFDNEDKVVGQLISDKENEYIYVDQEDKQIHIVNMNKVAKINICRIDNSWMAQTIISTFSKARLVNQC